LIKAAGHWFLKSGIQEALGGVARYYRTDLRQNAPVSTEITGYALSTLLYFHERTGDTAYLDSALKAARFLARDAWDEKSGTFPFELLAVDSALNPPSGYTYFFDCGIIVRGLLYAWRVTQEAEFRDRAIAAGHAMLTDFPSQEGIHPILALPEKRPLNWEPRWSASPGCYQLKSALAWRDLFEVTGDKAFLDGYESALAAALNNYPEFLPGDPDQQRVMDRLHPYCYFLEGLLPVLDRPECVAAFRSGVDRVRKYLVGIAPVFARSDVYGQLLRVRLLGEALGALALDRSAAAHEAEQTASFQIHASNSNGDSHLGGGFLFGRKQGEPMPFVNPVSTGFCTQAVALWQDREAGRPLISLHALV
jgi:hypothetical protein